MPTKKAQEVDEFIQNYKNYVIATQNAFDWTNRIVQMAELIKNDANFLDFLDEIEQTDVVANSEEAKKIKITPAEVFKPLNTKQIEKNTK